MDQTTSFPCPKCKQEGKNSWANRKNDGGFLCPTCGSTYSSYESAKELLDEI